MELQGKVAIVTGASQGIGRDIAAAFAREGATVVLVARREPEVQQAAAELVAAGGKAVGWRADVSREEDVQRVVQRTAESFGTLDILVNNAGIAGPVAPIWEVDLAGWRECLDINLTGAWLCCREAVKVMMKRHYGKIINIGSISGKRPLARRTPYCASKMGLVGLTRTLALEVGEFSINVNNVSPGAVNTARLALLAEKAGRPLNAFLAAAAKSVPLQRISEGSDIAALCVFLASDAAHNITGQDINVDAGAFMG